MQSHAPNSVMTDLEICEADIYKRLKELKINKSPCPDMIHPRVLQEIASEIAGYLKILFELSLRKSEIPNDWKCSNVCVIHKKGSKSNINNYRPINFFNLYNMQNFGGNR